jgi:predicted nucleic acid-binding protein
LSQKDLHLDTNCLIDLLFGNSKTRSILKAKLLAGWICSTSTLAWHEFVCGPLQSEQKQDIWDFLEGRVLPMDFEIAELAAEIFNKSGRKKGSKPDCIIAATAIYHNATLLTWNKKDFRNIKKLGFALNLD